MSNQVAVAEVVRVSNTVHQQAGHYPKAEFGAGPRFVVSQAPEGGRVFYDSNLLSGQLGPSLA